MPRNGNFGVFRAIFGDAHNGQIDFSQILRRDRNWLRKVDFCRFDVVFDTYNRGMIIRRSLLVGQIRQ